MFPILIYRSVLTTCPHSTVGTNGRSLVPFARECSISIRGHSYYGLVNLRMKFFRETANGSNAPRSLRNRTEIRLSLLTLRFRQLLDCTMSTGEVKRAFTATHHLKVI